MEIEIFMHDLGRNYRIDTAPSACVIRNQDRADLALGPRDVD